MSEGTATTAGGEGRRARLEASLADVEHAQRSLLCDRRRMRWVALAAVLALPLGWHWGLGVAAVAVAVAVGAAVFGTYITWAHRQEYAAAETVIREQLASVDGANASSPRRGVPWRVPGKALVLFE